MTHTQIIQSLTPFQKDELNRHLKELEDKVSAKGNITPDKLGEVDVNLRLDNDSVFLNMTVMFVLGANGKLIGQIANMVRFQNVDEYLDSINLSNGLNGDWKTLK